MIKVTSQTVALVQLGANRYGGIIPVAQQWQTEEPESEDARYTCVHNVCTAARGKACLPISAVLGKLPIYTS